VFFRYCFEENIQEDFMCCRLLTERTTGSDMFKAVNDYITSEDISWSNCVDICTDGAATLTGHKKGLQAEGRQVAPHVNFIYCIIHGEDFASRNIQPPLHTVL
jgi:hypothetical protein